MRATIVVLCALVTTAMFAAADTPKPNPKQAAIHNRQGKVYFDTKQYDQAIVEFKQSQALDPKSVTLFKIASAYYAKGDYEGAIDYYAQYLASDPDGALAQQALEFTAIARKQIADAKAKADADAKAKADAAEQQRLAAAAEAKRVAAAAHTKQAEAFAQAGAWTSAGDEYRGAAQAGDDPAFLIQAAEAYAKQPDHEKARAAYLEYLAKVPLGPKSDELRTKVAELTRAIDKAIAERAAEEARLRKEAEARRHVPEETSSFEFAASLAPGVKLHADNPFVIALRGEAALRLGRRVNLGLYVEYGRVETSGACGTDLPGPEPATELDFGPRTQQQKCSYLLPGLQLYVHVLPASKIDPYIGVAPGFRFGSVAYTEHFNGMTTSHDATYLGIVLGVRAGVTYRLQPGPHAWSVGGFVEGAYQMIGDEESAAGLERSGGGRFLTMFVGGRSTVTF